MTQPSIEHQITFLYTSDLVATACFYEDILGLELALDQGDCRIYRATQDASIGFCQRNTASQPTGVVLTLVSRQVDEWYADLRSRGVAFEHAPVYNPDYQIYHCFLRDPNGYLIEIQRFEDPRWSKSLSMRSQ